MILVRGCVKGGPRDEPLSFNVSPRLMPPRLFLCVGRFHHRLPHGKLAIMATYYAGQAGIALSAMGGQLEQQGPQKVRLARWGTNFFSYGYQWVDKQQ